VKQGRVYADGWCRSCREVAHVAARSVLRARASRGETAAAAAAAPLASVEVAVSRRGRAGQVARLRPPLRRLTTQPLPTTQLVAARLPSRPDRTDVETRVIFPVPSPSSSSSSSSTSSSTSSFFHRPSRFRRPDGVRHSPGQKHTRKHIAYLCMYSWKGERIVARRECREWGGWYLRGLGGSGGGEVRGKAPPLASTLELAV
jgi:hypothetical protein